MSPVRVGVLVSGSGSNLQAILDATAPPDHPAEVAVVVCNRPRAFALERATRAGVPTVVLSHRPFPSRDAYDEALVRQLGEHGVEWVVCAGFMRVLGPRFVRAFAGRILNIHPALLPSFPGLHAQRQALEAGVAVAGCTVHFVDEGVDTGPIIAQGVVPVLAGDDEASLSARILTAEHALYPRVLRWAVEGQLQITPNGITGPETRVWGLHE